MTKPLRLVLLGMLLLVTCPILAQEWKPTEEFPLLFNRMEKAVVHYGIFQDHAKTYPCNIHLGTSTKTHALIYADEAGTVMETEPANVNYVEFPDGKYVPIEQKFFGKIILEDSVGKVIMVRDINRHKMTEAKRSTESETTRLNLQYMKWYVPSESDVQLPMIKRFYFQFRGEIFEITEKNILSHINQDRRKEYRAYTRNAEVISTNESSVLKLWADFFVNYDEILNFYKKH